jgi:farnesyl-diphosphate farnesyltransferase
MLRHYVTPPQREYLRTWAARTSRSFAVMFPHLDEPMDSTVTAAYLLCRVADNIEDGLVESVAQREAFASLRRALAEPEAASDVLRGWSALAWPHLTADEAALMSPEHGLPLWDFYARLPAATRAILRRWVEEMAHGMDQATNGGPPAVVARGAIRVLASADDTHRYCYVVAGTAGHMLTELAAEHYVIDEGELAGLRVLAERCGRALQKTNILKDFAEDRARGVCYLPDAWLAEIDHRPLSLSGAPLAWKRRVIADVLDDLEVFLRYIAALPRRAVGFRLGMLVCVLPAYATLRLMAERRAQMFGPEHAFKISRADLERCIGDARRVVLDGEAIAAHGAAVASEIDAIFAAAARRGES